MEPPAEEARPDGPSPVADAIGGATVFPARVAARVLRGPLETAVEDLVSAPEIGRILDRALSGPLPEELALSLARHHVLERVVRKLAVDGELERLLEAALASPRTHELLDRALSSPRTHELLDEALSSDATRHVLERAIGGPEVRAAVARQSAGFAEQVAAGVRRAARRADPRVTLRGSPVSTEAPFAGVVSRGIGLFVDALVIVGATIAVGAAAALVGALFGGIRPAWLAESLLSLAGFAIALGYFSLFWGTVGQTPGMRLMHVSVLHKRADRRLTVKRSVVRTIGLALAIIPCFLGFLPALFDSERRALPDYLASTVVVYDDLDPKPR
jgi:uncharacterized RDD family membrane protein YckC